MAAYSVAEAKHRLPVLIDKAPEGEQVVIIRHGTPVAELRPRVQRDHKSHKAMLEWLIARRKATKGVGITSAEMLNQMHEDDER